MDLNLSGFNLVNVHFEMLLKQYKKLYLLYKNNLKKDLKVGVFNFNLEGILLAEK